MTASPAPAPDSERLRRRVIVLAGPSGAGKSRLAARLGLPVLRLDDFYKDHDDPTLPRITTGANTGQIDWDHPDSWNCASAVAALTELCRSGATEAPDYSIPLSRATGSHTVTLGDAAYFVAEGIFAAEVVAPARNAGILLAAYCITQHPAITWWRRLRRDLSKSRKPPLMLVIRGFALARAQRSIVAYAAAKGCTVASSHVAYRELTDTMSAGS